MAEKTILVIDVPGRVSYFWRRYIILIGIEKTIVKIINSPY